MDRTRVARVENVIIARRGEQVKGTLHLTPHHLIFSHTPQVSGEVLESGAPIRPKELWITYPMISFCTLRAVPSVSRQPSSVRLRCRDFTFVCFYFASEAKARDVYDALKQWTCKVGRVEKLYAFTYQPPPPELEINGWNLYDAAKEWARQGVGKDDASNGWRISTINIDYNFSPTYPALLPVPAAISDNTLNYAGRYRSRARIPVLTYLHPVNNCSITRSSQPLVGVRQNRSIQDEKLLATIFSTSNSDRPLAGSTPPSLDHESTGSTLEEVPSTVPQDFELTNAEELEDEVLSAAQGSQEEKPQVYGAQQRNLIVDARPTVNAFAMQAVGLGSENMDNYKFATKAYLGIDNIHVMRDSLNKVMEALKESDLTPLGPNRELLAKSQWLKYISVILEGASLIARQVGIHHSHVLIHCSDGWDRTSQLSALSQLCLDPYYRTLEGFMVLVEKDWLSFGHMFRHRAGLLNSEKWFQIENERIGGDTNRPFGETSEPRKALENAFLSAKNFFNRDNTSRDSLVDSDSEMQNYDNDSPLRKPSSTPRSAANEKEATKVKETSPVFHQFLDATYQLLYQHPTRFEFNERFLRRLLYHLYSCQYGTFLYNSEKERVEANAKERTRSVWDYFLARREQFINPKYDPLVDDKQRSHERLIFPRIDEVRWWSEIFGRSDAEMNGTRTSRTSPSPLPARSTSNTGRTSPVVTGVETSNSHADVHSGDASPGEATASKLPPTRSSDLTAKLSNLTMPKLHDATESSKKEVELEMR